MNRMKISEAPEILQSSCLAPLFLNLENPIIDEINGKIAIGIQVRNPISEKKPARMTFIEDKQAVRIFLNGFSKASSPETILTQLYSNNLSSVPKVCWDNKNNEIYYVWTIFTDESHLLNVFIFERVLAHFLDLFLIQRQRAVKMETKRILEKDFDNAQDDFKQICNRIEFEFIPLVKKVLEDYV